MNKKIADNRPEDIFIISNKLTVTPINALNCALKRALAITETEVS